MGAAAKSDVLFGGARKDAGADLVVFGDLLGMDAAAVDALEADGVSGGAPERMPV